MVYNVEIFQTIMGIRFGRRFRVISFTVSSSNSLSATGVPGGDDITNAEAGAGCSVGAPGIGYATAYWDDVSLNFFGPQGAGYTGLPTSETVTSSSFKAPADFLAAGPIVGIGPIIAGHRAVKVTASGSNGGFTNANLGSTVWQLGQTITAELRTDKFTQDPLVEGFTISGSGPFAYCECFVGDGVTEGEPFFWPSGVPITKAVVPSGITYTDPTTGIEYTGIASAITNDGSPNYTGATFSILLYRNGLPYPPT